MLLFRFNAFFLKYGTAIDIILIIWQNATAETPVSQTKPSDDASNTALEPEKFGKGIVFYTKNDRVVGIIMWNTFQCMPIARKVKPLATVYYFRCRIVTVNYIFTKIIIHIHKII